MPLFQDYQMLSLRPMQIPIDLKNTLTSNKLRVNVPAVFTVAIGTSPDLMQNAAQRLLGSSHEDVEHQAQEII